MIPSRTLLTRSRSTQSQCLTARFGLSLCASSSSLFIASKSPPFAQFIVGILLLQAVSQHPKILFLAHGALFLAPGALFLAPGALFLAPGALFLAPGALFKELGTFFQE
jgi:hypothetical protein